MSIQLEVSIGEFVDRLTILQIKSERITDPAKLANIRRELEGMLLAWREAPFAEADISADLNDLRTVNEILWDLEDEIRALEAGGEFDTGFVEVARAIYKNNDIRAGLKRRINERLGSGLVEEKSYQDYGRGR